MMVLLIKVGNYTGAPDNFAASGTSFVVGLLMVAHRRGHRSDWTNKLISSRVSSILSYG